MLPWLLDVADTAADRATSGMALASRRRKPSTAADTTQPETNASASEPAPIGFRRIVVQCLPVAGDAAGSAQRRPPSTAARPGAQRWRTRRIVWGSSRSMWRPSTSSSWSGAFVPPGATALMALLCTPGASRGRPQPLNTAGRRGAAQPKHTPTPPRRRSPAHALACRLPQDSEAVERVAHPLLVHRPARLPAQRGQDPPRVCRCADG